jgi:hypothetical protein
MALRKLLTRPLPEMPSEAPGIRSVVDQALATPQLLPARLFYESLNEMRPWWPVLVPLLLWVFWSRYRRERAKVLAEQAALLDEE